MTFSFDRGPATAESSQLRSNPLKPAGIYASRWFRAAYVRKFDINQNYKDTIS